METLAGNILFRISAYALLFYFVERWLWRDSWESRIFRALSRGFLRLGLGWIFCYVFLFVGIEGGERWHSFRDFPLWVNLLGRFCVWSIFWAQLGMKGYAFWVGVLLGLGLNWGLDTILPIPKVPWEMAFLF